MWFFLIFYWMVISALTFLHKSKIQSRMFISLICLIIMESVEILVRLNFYAFSLNSLDQLNQGKNRFFFLIIYSIGRLVPFVIIQIYKRIVSYGMLNKNKNERVSTIKQFTLLLIPVLSIISIVLLGSLENELDRVSMLYVAIAIGLILFINIIYFYIYNIVIDRYEKIAENLILNKTIEYHNNQYLHIENSLKEIKSIKHDLKLVIFNT